MDNIKEVRQELCTAFNDLKNGKLEVKTAAEMSNMAGKVINSLKVELEYSALRKEKPQIDFLDNNEKKKTA